MDLETPLKSQKDIMNEGLEKGGLEKIETKEEKRSSQLNVDLTKFERRMAEAKAKEDDAKKLQELESKIGVKLTGSIQEKLNEASDLKTESGAQDNLEEKTERGIAESEKNRQEYMEMMDLQNEKKANTVIPEKAVDEEPERVSNNIIDLESRRTGRISDQVKDIEESPLDYAKRDVSEYLHDKEVSGRLDPEELEKFNQDFSAEASSLVDEESLQKAASRKISNITDYINEKRTAEKEKSSDKPKEEIISEKVIKPEEYPVKDQLQEAPKPEDRMKSDVQSEPLKDFTHKIKRGYERSKMEDDVVMQAMEDFIESTKSKDSISSTVKNFIGFLKERKKDMKTGFKYTTDAVLGAMRDFSGYAKEKLDERRKRPVAEASLIDRIMRGDTRSDEAVKIDGNMEKALKFDEKTEKISEMMKKLKKAETQDDLIHALDGVDIIANKKGVKYEVSEQQNYIKQLFNSGDERWMRWITRAPGSENEGIRSNVNRVFRKWEAKRMDAFKEEMKKKKNDQEGFDKVA